MNRVKGECMLLHETTLKTHIWQKSGYTFDDDEKLKHVVSFFFSRFRTFIPSQDTNEDLHISSSTNLKVTKKASSDLPQLKLRLTNQTFLQI